MTRARLGAAPLVLVTALALGACASTGAPSSQTTQAAPEAPPAQPPPPPGPSARARLAAPHHEQADRLERDGRLRQALDERRIALTIDPNDAMAQAALARLEDTIARGVARQMEEGRAALARGAHVEARRRFLAALALDPNGRPAFDALQREVRDLEFITHVVRQGDTLASLGQRYYNDRTRAEVISEMNELAPGTRLAVGRTLKIPEIPGVPLQRPDSRPEPRPEPRREPRRPTEPAPAPPAETSPAAVETNPLLLEAQEAFERKEYVVALADLDKVLAATPTSTEAVGLKKQVLYAYGRSRLEARDYETSHRALAQLVRIDAKYQNVTALSAQARERLIDQRYSQGIRLFREEKLREAITAWRGVLDLDPNHANARKNIEQSERLLKGLEERRRK